MGLEKPNGKKIKMQQAKRKWEGLLEECGRTAMPRNRRKLSPIDKESMAIFRVCRHMDYYIRGVRNMAVAIDHWSNSPSLASSPGPPKTSPSGFVRSGKIRLQSHSKMGARQEGADMLEC